MAGPEFFPDAGWEDLARLEVEQRRRQSTAIQAIATPQLASSVADMSFMYPNLAPGVVTAAAAAGLDPMGQDMAALNQRSLEVDAQSITPPGPQEASDNWFIRGGKAALRGLFTGFDMVYDEVTRGLTRLGTGIAQDRINSIDDIDLAFGQSAGAWAAQIGRQGHRVNLGSGIFPESELSDETLERVAAGESIETAWRNPSQIELGLPITQFVEARRENPNEAITLENPNAEPTGTGFAQGSQARNLAITPGRMLARAVTQPGTKPFNIFSGIGDVAANIFLDPANIAGGFVGDLRSANRLLLPNGVRPTVLARNVDDWLMSDSGRRVSQFLAENQDYRTTYGLLSRATGRRAPDAALARTLTRTSDPTEVAESIRQAVHAGQLNQVIGRQTLHGRAARALMPTRTLDDVAAPSYARVAGPVAAIRRQVTPRPVRGVLDAWTAEVGSTTLRIDDTDDMVFRMGEWMKVARFGDDEISATMSRLAAVEPGQYETAFGIVAETTQRFADRLTEDGIPAPITEQFSQIFKDYSDMRQYFNDAVGQPEMFPGAKFTVTIDGEVIEQPTAHLMAEFLSSNIPLPDVRKTRQAYRRARMAQLVGSDVALQTMRGKIEKFDDLRPGVIMNLMDKVQRVWKPMTLLRLAWPVRVIGEEQVRMAAGGLDSAARHPLHWLALTMGREGNTALDGQAFANFATDTARTITRRVRNASTGQVDEVTEVIPIGNAFSRWYRGVWEYESGEMAAAMSRKGGSIAQNGKPGQMILSNNWERAQRGFHPRHMEGWAVELSKLSRDPVARRVAQASTEVPFGSGLDSVVDNLVDEFMDEASDLGQLRTRLVADGNRWAGLEQRAGAEGYVRSVMARIIKATGGEYSKFDHVTGRWMDMAGNTLDEAILESADVGGRILHQSSQGGNVWAFDRVTYRYDRLGNADIVDAIASGRVGATGFDDAGRATGGVKLGTPEWSSEVTETVSIETLARKLDDIGWSEYAPEFTTVARRADPATTQRLDRVVDVMFQQLMSRPTNFLSRSPAFRQFYWKKVSELMPMMDEATQRAAINAAAEAGLGRTRLRNLARGMIGDTDPTEAELNRLAGLFAGKTGRITDTATGHITTIDDADELAKAFALEETKRLLYDVENRTNFFDITRNIFPFGEAWAEIMGTWGRLITDDPRILRRAQQGIEGMRDSDLDGDGNGLFYEDPDTGEEVFSFVGSPWMTSHLYKDENGGPRAEPVFTGRVSGLNLALGSFVPGVGPTVQIPLAAVGEGILADPNFSWLRKFAFPFQAPDVESLPDVGDALLPAWFQKAQVAIPFFEPQGEHQRLFENTIKDVLRAMEVNGEIDYSQPGAMEAAITSATGRARFIYAIRSLSQFVGPVGAQVRWEVDDPEANQAISFLMLGEDYRRILDEHNNDQSAAFTEFVQRYGVDPAAFATAKSQQVIARSVTEPGLEFQQSNPQLFRDFELTAYFARPDGPDEEFEYGAYTAQFADGTRVSLSPEEWVRRRNDMLGRVQYDRARAQFGPMVDRPYARAYLNQFRIQLMEEYPGYGFDNFGTVVAADPDMVRAEFETWRGNDLLANTSAGRGLIAYLDKRDQFIQAAAAQGISEGGFGSADATRYMRAALRNYAESLMADPRFTDFAPIFARYYRREVTEQAPAGFVAPQALTDYIGND